MHHIYFFQNKKIKKCEKRCKYHRSTLSSYCTKVIYAGSVIFYGFDILLSFLWVYQISTQSILKINHLAVQTKTKQFSIGIHYAVKTTLKEKLCGLKICSISLIYPFHHFYLHSFVLFDLKVSIIIDSICPIFLFFV